MSTRPRKTKSSPASTSRPSRSKPTARTSPFSSNSAAPSGEPMQRSETKPQSQPEENVGAHPRIVAILALTAVLIAFAILARGVYYAATDSWIVPINLSPDNDAVVQVNIRLNEQLMERARLRADADRIAADVQGVDTA